MSRHLGNRKNLLVEQNVRRRNSPAKRSRKKSKFKISFPKFFSFRSATKINLEPISERSCVFRVYALMSFFGVFTLVIFSRLYVLQQEESSKWLKLAFKQHQSLIKVKGARGSIVDTNGKALAVSVKSYSLGMHPHHVKDEKEFSTQLAALLDQKPKEILKKVRSDKSFVWLARGLSLIHI